MTRALLSFFARVLLAACVILAVIEGEAQAHERWADGSTIPAWVKSACCGPQDAFIIDSGDVSGPDTQGFYRVKDIGNLIPSDRVYDSQDGQTWVFYNPQVTPAARYVYCLFLSRGF